MVNTPKSKKQQKKAAGQAQHRQLLKDKEDKRKARKKASLPSSYSKGKK